MPSVGGRMTLLSRSVCLALQCQYALDDQRAGVIFAPAINTGIVINQRRRAQRVVSLQPSARIAACNASFHTRRSYASILAIGGLLVDPHIFFDFR